MVIKDCSRKPGLLALMMAFLLQAVDKGGYQKELPDIWLTDGNPWEVKRSEIKYEVSFGGRTEKKNGATVWIPGQKV